MLIDKKAILMNTILADLSIPHMQRVVLSDKVYFIQDEELLDILYQSIVEKKSTNTKQSIMQKITSLRTHAQKIHTTIDEIKDQKIAQKFLEDNLASIS